MVSPLSGETLSFLRKKESVQRKTRPGSQVLQAALPSLRTDLVGRRGETSCLVTTQTNFLFVCPTKAALRSAALKGKFTEVRVVVL